MFSLRIGRLTRLGTKSAAAIAMAAFVSGCSMGSLLGGGGTTSSQTTGSVGSLANASASQADINSAALDALPAIATECPPIKVRNGGEALYTYQNNQVGDPRALQFQAVIDNESRNCVVSNGLITVKMGVVGRVLLGPAGTQTNVTVPLRFAVQRDDLAVFSQKYDIPVALKNGAQTQDFVKIVDNVAIPYVGGENIVIWVGFDTSKG